MKLLILTHYFAVLLSRPANSWVGANETQWTTLASHRPSIILPAWAAEAFQPSLVHASRTDTFCQRLSWLAPTDRLLGYKTLYSRLLRFLHILKWQNRSTHNHKANQNIYSSPINSIYIYKYILTLIRAFLILLSILIILLTESPILQTGADFRPQ